jgi:hypothetical protein
MVLWYHPLVWRSKSEFYNIGCFDELDPERVASAARKSLPGMDTIGIYKCILSTVVQIGIEITLSPQIILFSPSRVSQLGSQLTSRTKIG